MPIILNGSGSINGLNPDGLPDSCVTTNDLADGAVTPAKLSQPLTLMTAKAYNWNGATTNTFIDFTGIPSWVKRVTVMFQGVSTNGTSPPQIQIGTSSGIETTGYLGSNGLISTGVANANFTSGFGIGVNTANWGAARVVHGWIGLTLLGSNGWTASGQVGASDLAGVYFTTGSKTLSGTLDRIRITTLNGTDTFDAGSINIMYE